MMCTRVWSVESISGGKKQGTPASNHSRGAQHYVFINLKTERIYCLPDGYEICDPSLDDIRHVLNPRFIKQHVQEMDKDNQLSKALDGSNYLPGTVGLNNLRVTDFLNVTIQSLMRVTPLRNFFLIPENYQHNKSKLVLRFGELTRKIWHSKNFKKQVNPYEFVKEVKETSEKRFPKAAQSDPAEFMVWLLSTLDKGLKGSRKASGIIQECFQGELEIAKETHDRSLTEKKEKGEIQNKADQNKCITETIRKPFVMLRLDLPPPPPFNDAMGNIIIPQLNGLELQNSTRSLMRFLSLDGESVTEGVCSTRYCVTRLPKYLILHMRRFTKNNFFLEKNPTFVNFPVKNLELRDYIPFVTTKREREMAY